jgi:lipopolysaccharide/colanic/teichoic acid biosynthesis glycosyltransferase
MNNPEHFIPPGYGVLAKQHLDPGSAVGGDFAAEGHADVSARPALFLAWSNAHEVAATEMNCDPTESEIHIPSSSPVPSRNRWNDRGLWLLRDAFIRREGWLRLNALPMAVPVPNQVSCRRSYAVAKRVVDVAGAVALLVLLMPILLFVAALVRLDSPGPALFRQRRVGRDGKEFQLWKFRSMRIDAPKYAPSPTSDRDCRLTRIGRLIRRISIDELPQLINVLKGEMSLVGPRPEMPFIVDRYTPLERGRLAVKPGITGLWQVSPARALPIHENLQYDLHYIFHQSLMLDGAILLRTLAAVIRGVGAV